MSMIDSIWNGLDRFLGIDRRNGSADTTAEMEYFANNPHDYKDNHFTFKFKRVNGEWHIYIEKMPPLNGRASDAHSTHRYTNSLNGKRYVCRKPQPKTLAEAQAVARVWADKILEYIVTGTTF